MWRLAFGLIMLASAAAAQPASPTPTPSQTAIQLTAVIDSWAQAIETLQEQNARLRERVKELEDKYEPHKTPAGANTAAPAGQ